jgi:hypothetical protein
MKGVNPTRWINHFERRFQAILFGNLQFSHVEGLQKTLKMQETKEDGLRKSLQINQLKKYSP